MGIKEKSEGEAENDLNLQIKDWIIYIPALSIFYSVCYFRTFFNEFKPLRASYLTLADYFDKAAWLLLNSIFTILIFSVMLLMFLPPIVDIAKTTRITKFLKNRSSATIANAIFFTPMILTFFFVPYLHPIAGGVLLFLFLGLGPAAAFHQLAPKLINPENRYFYSYLAALLIYSVSVTHAAVDARGIKIQNENRYNAEKILVEVFQNGYLYLENNNLSLYDRENSLLQSAKIERVEHESQACLIGITFVCRAKGNVTTADEEKGNSQ